jgi:hypothetical protein
MAVEKIGGSEASTVLRIPLDHDYATIAMQIMGSCHSGATLATFVESGLRSGSRMTPVRCQ